MLLEARIVKNPGGSVVVTLWIAPGSTYRCKTDTGYEALDWLSMQLKSVAYGINETHAVPPWR